MGFRTFTSVALLGVILTGCGGGGGGGSSSNGNAVSTTIPQQATPVATLATPSTDAAPACAAQLDTLFNDLVRETNLARTSRGFSALTVSNKLNLAAQGHAQDMADGDYFAHNSPDGTSTLATRLDDVGYSFTAAGENLAAGYSSAAEAVNDWLNSPGHRQNLLNPDYVEVGFGLVFDTTYGTGPETFDSYWVQNFGIPTDNNTDIQSSDLFQNCNNEAPLIAADSAVLNGAITADVPETTGDNLDTSAAFVAVGGGPAPVSTPEPAMALGLLWIRAVLSRSQPWQD